MALLALLLAEYVSFFVAKPVAEIGSPKCGEKPLNKNCSAFFPRLPFRISTTRRVDFKPVRVFNGKNHLKGLPPFDFPSLHVKVKPKLVSFNNALLCRCASRRTPRVINNVKPATAAMNLFSPQARKSR